MSLPTTDDARGRGTIGRRRQVETDLGAKRRFHMRGRARFVSLSLSLSLSLALPRAALRRVSRQAVACSARYSVLLPAAATRPDSSLVCPDRHVDVLDSTRLDKEAARATALSVLHRTALHRTTKPSMASPQLHLPVSSRCVSVRASERRLTTRSADAGSVERPSSLPATAVVSRYSTESRGRDEALGLRLMPLSALSALSASSASSATLVAFWGGGVRSLPRTTNTKDDDLGEGRCPSLSAGGVRTARRRSTAAYVTSTGSKVDESNEPRSRSVPRHVTRAVAHQPIGLP